MDNLLKSASLEKSQNVKSLITDEDLIFIKPKLREMMYAIDRVWGEYVNSINRYLFNPFYVADCMRNILQLSMEHILLINTVDLSAGSIMVANNLFYYIMSISDSVNSKDINTVRNYIDAGSIGTYDKLCSEHSWLVRSIFVCNSYFERCRYYLSVEDDRIDNIPKAYYAYYMVKSFIETINEIVIVAESGNDTFSEDWFKQYLEGHCRDYYAIGNL